jgi:hypothetical protein
MEDGTQPEKEILKRVGEKAEKEKIRTLQTSCKLNKTRAKS